MKKIIKRFKDITELSLAAANYTAILAKAEVKKKGYFAIALSGGKTIIPFYKQLAKTQMPWDKTYIFWQDDRFVKYGDKDSNVKLVYDKLISKTKMSFEKVYPAPAPDNVAPASKAAKIYEMIIRQLFKHLQPGKKIPSYDLIIAGMGDDGHTASIFPKDKKVLNEKKKLIISVIAPPYAVVKDRITMTLPFINNAKNIMFLTEEKGRSKVLQLVLQGNKKYPAALVKPKKELIWMINKKN
ncbi:MAG: 6-phosphogluconolactonase [bacterium]